MSVPTFYEFVKLCNDEWLTPRWYHRVLRTWAFSRIPRRLTQHDTDFGKAPRWRMLTTPAGSEDFSARAHARLHGERASLLVMDEATGHAPTSSSDILPQAEPPRARVSVETLLAFELPTEQGHRRTQNRS